MTKWIEENLYRKIHEVMVIPCTDLVIKHQQAGMILLVLRGVEPAKGQWWLPGGRIHKGETLLEASERIALKEVGLSIIASDSDYLRPVFLNFEKDPYGHGKGTSAISLPVVTQSLNWIVELDKNHKEYAWVDPRKPAELLPSVGNVVGSGALQIISDALSGGYL